MTMHSGRGDFNPKNSTLLSDVMNTEVIERLIHSDSVEEMVTVLQFIDPQQALDWAECIHKCRRHNLVEKERKYWLKALALCAVEGRRASMISQTLMRVAVPEFYGGKGDGSNKSGNTNNK